jgi:hypothetical protein
MITTKRFIETSLVTATAVVLLTTAWLCHAAEKL